MKNKEQDDSYKRVEQEYASLLDGLVLCTKDLKVREAYIAEHTNPDEFKMNLLVWGNYSGGKAGKFFQMDQLELNGYGGLSKKYCDGLTFVEAMQHTLVNYSDRNHNFLKTLETNYYYMELNRQSAEKLTNNTGGFTIADPEKKSSNRYKAAVLRLMITVGQLQESSDVRQSYRNLVYEQLDKINEIPKKDYDVIYRFLTDFQLPIGSFQNTASDDDGNEFCPLENKTVQQDPYEILFEHGNERFESVLAGWDELSISLKKKTRDCYKALLSRSLLEALKLKVLDSGERERYTEEPAGNAAIYDFLETYEEKLESKIWHRSYVNSAYDASPENLEEIYRWLLRKTFRFTDQEIADILEIQKPNMSKISKKYQEIFLQSLMEFAQF